jgi:hypothetical protein
MAFQRVGSAGKSRWLLFLSVGNCFSAQLMAARSKSEATRRQAARLLRAQGLNTSTFKSCTAEKCLTLAVSSISP